MYVNRREVEEVVERARELGTALDVAHLDPRWQALALAGGRRGGAPSSI